MNPSFHHPPRPLPARGPSGPCAARMRSSGAGVARPPGRAFASLRAIGCALPDARPPRGGLRVQPRASQPSLLPPLPLHRPGSKSPFPRAQGVVLASRPPVRTLTPQVLRTGCPSPDDGGRGAEPPMVPTRQGAIPPARAGAKSAIGAERAWLLVASFAFRDTLAPGEGARGWGSH